MNTQITTNERLYYLDAVRAFALILGVIFHASLSFMPVFIGWAVMDISTSHLVSVFVLISHSFRMELFFLIAGYFGHLKFHQQNKRNFLTSRFIKIAIPFILGWFFLRPLLVSGWTIGGESMRGDANIMNGLSTGFSILSELPKGLFIGTHLWFLYYLLIITVGVIVLRSLIGLHKPFNTLLIKWSDTFIGWLCSSRLGGVVIAIPTTVCLWFMNDWGVDTPDKSLFPDIPVVLIYGGFFIFGWMIERHSNLIVLFSKISLSKLIIGILSIVITVLLAGFQMKYGHPNYQLIKVGYLISYAIMMWSLVSISIGIFRMLFKRSNTVIRYMADASYWLYLIHLPLVIWLQVAFAELPFHWSIKLFCISGLTILISTLVYDVLVRSTFIGKLLNGKRKARCIF